MDYLKIPDQFRSTRNRWNQLAFHLHDVGLEDVRLIPKPGIDPQAAWHMTQQALQNPKQQHFHRCAHAAWILWSAYEDFYYYYD